MPGSAVVDELALVVRDAFGPGCRIVGVDRLRGGTKKGVYRVRLNGAGSGVASVVVYRWAAEEDFWGGGVGDGGADPFAHASGLEPFLVARRRLVEVGARVPDVLFVDGGRGRCGADVAVVEDVGGGNLEELLDADTELGRAVLGDLSRMLDLVHRDRNSRYGRVDLVERGGRSLGESCEGVVLDRALRDLGEAAGREPRVGAVRGQLDDRLRELHALVEPRSEYSLIHGELGPDHVLVTLDGAAVLIDIEGLMYFDVEWEHVFLRQRFHEHYAVLERPGLDPRRVELYRLAMHLSLVAGPLRLLDGDFPDRAAMLGIVEHSLREALALVGRRG